MTRTSHCALHLRARAEHMNNTNPHTTIHSPYGIAGVRSSTICYAMLCHAVLRIFCVMSPYILVCNGLQWYVVIVLYVIVCRSMSMYLVVCYCMLLYVIACYCLLLYVIVCCCMLLYGVVCPATQ